jgi:hypothetical protein
MEWLEIIELRTGGSNRDLLESRLQELISEMEMEEEQQAIKSYFHGIISTDLSVHLFHESEKVERGGSWLGLHLASALKEFGLVNHSVWIETQTK